MSSPEQRRHVKVLRGGVVVAVASAALMLPSSCLPPPSPWSGSGVRVAFAGDSELYQLEHDLPADGASHMTDAFVAAGYQVTTATMIGAMTEDLRRLVALSPSTAGWPGLAPQVTVTAMGVNDMQVGSTAGQPKVPVATAEANYGAYLDAVDAAGSACDVLVEIPETTPWGLDQTGVAWNAYLASAAATRVAIVVPWAGVVAEHPEYVWPPDGVHQTAEGKTVYLAAILDAVAQCATHVG